MERDREERSEDGRWMDGQIKKETAAARQRTHIPCKKGCEGEQVWFRGTERAPDKRGRVEEWRWRTLAVRTGAGMELDLISQVSSHYLRLLLSPLCPITATMQQAPSCRAAYGSLVVKPSLQSEAMRFLMGTVCVRLKGPQ